MYFFTCYVLSHVALILATGDLRHFYNSKSKTDNFDLQFELLNDADGEGLSVQELRRMLEDSHTPVKTSSADNSAVVGDSLHFSQVDDSAVHSRQRRFINQSYSEGSGKNSTIAVVHVNNTDVSPPITHLIAVANETHLERANATSLAKNNTVSVVPLQNEVPVTPLLPNESYSYPVELNDTILKTHNISQHYNDTHTYYNSTRIYDPDVVKRYWVDLSEHEGTVTNSLLSHSYRRASTVMLPFKFPFYGHEIENITIATGGFIYTGDYVHSWLAATQYIAPLMANFDTSLSNDSFIKYAYNDTSFTVLWENVALKDRPNSGNFTFEVTLHSNGEIFFVYKDIPNITADIQDENHPVKVGLSDAYILDRTIFFVRRKTIFEYHRVHFDKKDLKNWTLIHLQPQPTCLNRNTCESCLSEDTVFTCLWCDNRCSTGVDRMRHDWIKKGCDRRSINDTKHCSNTASDKIPVPGAHKATLPDMNESHEEHRTSVGSLLLLFTILIVMTVSLWTFYAYRNPHTTSGQILIRYRPSQWNSWRKGEARYTAATIHM